MTRSAPSSGLLVLGMHRSGTSALARVLDLCGADIGTRILKASTGNEAGHWEDALAVEVHERLLASFGTRWDEAMGLPHDWDKGEAASAARETIATYLETDRSRRKLWAVKDPRLSLFADVWIDAAAKAGQPLGAVFMLRHPLEVASSLAVRDGIAPGRGLLLWLEYTLAALRAADGLPCVLVTYDQLLEDWQRCVARIRVLPGGKHLKPGKAECGAIDAFLDESRRHHRAQGAARMPHVVTDVWKTLSAHADEDRLPPGVVRNLTRRIAPVRELLHPLLDELRVSQRQLWERVARAESLVDSTAPTSPLPAELAALRESVDQSHADVIRALSGDLRRMQATTAEAMQTAAVRAREAELVRQIEPRLQAVEAGLAPLAAELPAGLGELTKGIELHRAALVEAISGDLQRMQAVTAEAVQLAAVREREAELVRQIEPRLQAVEAGLTPLAAELPAGLGELTKGIELHRAALVEAISGELRRMQDTVTDAIDLLGRAQGEAEALRSLAPRLEEAVADRARVELAMAQMEGVLGDREKSLAQLEALHAEAAARAGQLESQLRELEAIRDEKHLQIAKLLREAHELRSRASLLEQVVASRSWRWTRPFRALRRLMTLQWAESDTAKIRGLFKHGRLGRKAASARLAPAQHLRDRRAAFEVAPQQEGMPDVFVWAVIDWHFRHQRPQHLAWALAEKGHRVFYISNNFVDASEPGFRMDPLDAEGRLFQIHLHHQGSPAIYFGMPDSEQAERMRASLAKLLEWTGTLSSVSLVQHPYWNDLLRAVPNARVVYDCMDHHAGFDNNAPTILEAEERIIADADLVIVTSTWLEQELGTRARATALIRNAGEFAHFHQAPDRVFKDARNRRVIGYYGAIAEWFDPSLVRRVSEAYPDVLVLLIGADTAGVQAELASLPNVQFTGEVPYSELPYWLHGFDVCLLPFKVIPLTLATNPVKVYEYLSAGKPVVAVDLPELSQFGDLVETGRTPDEFTQAIGRMLATGQKEPKKKARQAFAIKQTWVHRAEALDAELSRLREPRVSAIVLTFNNMAFTQACLSSVEAHSDYENLELIVVDNASWDGSREWLQEWAAERSAAGHQRRLILNDSNLGFSAGNNVGLRKATGDFLIILNNDTYVTPGWVRTLCAHLRRDPTLGLVGPVTNNIGNEARIEIQYSDMAEMIEKAGTYTRANAGRSMSMRNAAFFCVAMTRQAYEVVGGMDEDFGVGFFEDDDYCRRMERAGYGVACAEDVFIHHHLSASFDNLGSEEKRLLFDRNKAIYEAKWGEWQPHIYRNQTTRPTTDLDP